MKRFLTVFARLPRVVFTFGVAALLGSLAISAQATLIRVDFQASSGWPAEAYGPGVEPLASAADPRFGSSGSNIWDIRSRPGADTVSTSTFSNLLETSTGVATGVSIAFGNLTAAGNESVADYPLLDDCLILLDGVTDNPCSYTISGLTPNVETRLFLYSISSASQAERTFDFTANGSSPVNVNENGLEVITTADAQGLVSGVWSIPQGGGEANWSGFQLAQGVPVPEPSTCAMALAGLACGGYTMFRRRKRA
jgi:hypothetical protein